MHHPNLRGIPVQIVCVGSATLSAAYYAAWAPHWAVMAAIAAFAFTLDLVKPQMFAVAAERWREGRRKAAVWPAAFAALLAIVSMLAVDGMILRLRSDAGDGRTDAQHKHDRASAAYRRAEAELVKIGDVKPVEALKAEMQAAVPADIWARTKGCTDVTAKSSREACAPTLPIKAGVAVSERAAELEAEKAKAKRILDTSERPSAADPQIDKIARASGWSEASVVLLVTWLAGLAIELVSCFGPALTAPPAPPEAEKPPAAPPAPELEPEAKAREWLQGLLNTTDDGRLAVLNLNATIAKKYGVDPATATRWRKKWRKAGVFRERTEGRQIVLLSPRRRNVA